MSDHHNRNLTTRRAAIASLGAAMGVMVCSRAMAVPAAGSAIKTPPPPTGWQRIFLAPSTSTVDDWRQLGAAAFSLSGADAACSVKIAEVRALPAPGTRPVGSRAQAFAVLFQVSSGRPPRGDRAYRFSHAQYGSFDLFVGPLSLSGGKSVLVAVFN